MVAKFFDKIKKNPIEEFNLFAARNHITPSIPTFGIGFNDCHENPYHDSDNEQ